MKEILCVFTLFVYGTVWAGIIQWPTDTEWNPLYSGGGSLYEDTTLDTANNGHLYLDIVGGFDALNNEYAGAYLLHQAAGANNENEAQLMIRIRLNAAKSSNPGAYQVYFETTGDNSINWLLQFETTQKGSPQIVFGQATGTNSSSVIIGTNEWTGVAADYSQYTGIATADGSQFSSKPNGSPDDDYFLDVAMPWNIFSEHTQITSTNDPFRVLIVSSQSGGNAFDGDIGNTAAITDVNFADALSDSIPEPTTIGLLGMCGGSILIIRRFFMA